MGWLANLLASLFGKKASRTPVQKEYDEKTEMEWYNRKTGFFESFMGKEHDMVLHAMIPYAVGGPLDLYYYPNGIPGTGILTKELVESDGSGPSNKVYPIYELVMFTKHKLNMEDSQKEDTAFGKAHLSIHSVLNSIARYSAEAILNPNETCEFPQDMGRASGKCLVFDKYSQTKGPKGLGLMLILEVHRSEMEFARENGSGLLIQKLKDAGHYPYSDLDRPPVA